MLSFLNRIFSSPPKVPVSASPAAVAPNEHTSSVPAVEVARLRLSAILERFPDELKPLVLKIPEESVTVALPVSTILKQLASGSVRVSLATVHRQAPAGVFGPLPPGDKRLVEVPLHEVFRHVSPQALKRRSDQRAADGLTSEFNLFGNAHQPYQIAPTAPDEDGAPTAPKKPEISRPVPTAETAEASPAVLELDPIVPPARVIAPPPEFAPPLAFHPAPPPAPATPPAPAAAPEPIVPPIPRLSIVRPEPPAPAPSAPPPPPAAPVLTLSPNVPELRMDRVAAPPPGDVSIEVAVADLSTAWPEPIRQELAVLNGSGKIALPKSQVTAGLARGRVSFTWKQIASWLQPGLPQPSAQDEAIELTLPLKVVAPLFLATTRKAKPAAASFDTDIPALFADARHEPAPVEAEAAPAEIAPEPAAESASVVAEVAPTPVAATVTPPPPPATVGELFGEPGRTEWTPAHLVAGLAKRPGISGAVVALQEGLLVAHSLPEDVKSETIAAFLPQIFARLNQYSGEMKLGEVDDILFTTHGAHCQIYRLGFVYFAVLGKPGEPLPWSELRLVAEELARQTQPKD